MSAACPTTEQLAAALRGRPSSAAEAELAAHLVDCPDCRAQLEEMAGGSSWLETRAKAHAASAESASEFLHKAMQALEARSPGQETETAPVLRLDFLQPSDQPGVLGRIGPYEVLEQVAAGGMGIVLKARDPALNRIVALKILPPALAANALARARFIREARAAAAVVHEHVVPIYAVDEFAGLPYLVMQFIRGRPLSERIRVSGPLRVEEILRIGAQTAAGLAAAHAQGLIHRDVKPGNILLENSVERVKITDFGLARAVDDSSLTQDGHIAGTPEYMAPEQARNEPVDQRADLFSFGCVLYEMATGVSPFHAEKPLAALRRVCEEHPPPVHTLNDRIPEWLGLSIQKLMTKNPASRPQTALEVSQELGRRLAEFQQTSGPKNLDPRLRTPAAGSRRVFAVTIVLLLMAMVVFIATRPKSRLREDPIAMAPPGQTSSAAGSRPQRAPLFFVSAPGDRAEQGFATLTEAVEAAPAGAVIECRFNGVQAIRTLRRVEKALILRAAPGFEPVLAPLVPGEPILFTHAALVLEGLTLFNNPGRSEDGGRRGQPRVKLAVSVEGAPFLAAHCRFEINHGSDLDDRRQPHGVGLLNVPSANLLHCEIVSRTGFCLSWDWRGNPGGGEGGSRLWVQGCTVDANLMSISRRAAGAMNLELHQNTFAGDHLLLLLDYAPRLPVEVMASRNVFSVETLLRPRLPASESILKAVLRWQGESNIYAVASYLQSSPPMIRHEEWRAGVATGETASVAAELGLRSRLQNLANRTRAADAASFTLTAEERQRLSAKGWGAPGFPGADPQKTGPGQPYHNWRNSPDYAEWLKLVREHLPQSTAKP